MPEMDIDLERVISDPAYRRTVLNYLKNEADAKAEAPVLTRNAAEKPADRKAPTK